MSLGVVLLLCFFSRAIAVGFPVGPATYLVSYYWPLYLCQVWVSFHEVGLKSHQKVVGYFHNVCASIAPVYLAHRSHCRS